MTMSVVVVCEKASFFLDRSRGGCYRLLLCPFVACLQMRWLELEQPFCSHERKAKCPVIQRVV